MSRGRSRHQASRRRMYSSRQRDLRERRLHAARLGEPMTADDLVAFEIEAGEPISFEAPLPLRARARRDANAA